jgi:hypothetical protein
VGGPRLNVASRLSVNVLRATALLARELYAHARIPNPAPARSHSRPSFPGRPWRGFPSRDDRREQRASD